MMRLSLAYNRKNFSSGFFINYKGWKKISNYYLNGEDNNQYATKDGMPAWCTANICMSYKIHRFIILQARVDNIFDTQYRSFASGINAPWRNVFATLGLHY
jgi:hemoglobin/transferrin/lactoferrin receptor protein